VKRHSLKTDNSGQMFIIAALLIASLLLSTAIYVIETEKGVPIVNLNQVNFFPDYQQATRNTLISALANITNGGDSSILTSNLNELATAITSNSYQALFKMNYTVSNAAPYTKGVWISQGQNGQGISSAYATFVLTSLASSTNSNLEYNVNVTLEVDLTGNYQQLNGNLTQVNLTIKVLNEGEPALAQNFAFYFMYTGSSSNNNLTILSSPKITDFGNGTYKVLFTTESDPSNSPLRVSAAIQDQRLIFARANVTCTNLG
jgi:hypothetical protein